MYSLQSISADGQVRYFWIPGFNDAYVIGDNGSIWSRFKGIGNRCYISDDFTQLRLNIDKGGYYYVCLCFNGDAYTKKIHRLVCEAVYGPCPQGLEVCHNDGDTLNCNYWNLRYDTSENNHADKVKHGTDNRGERHRMAILTWVKVREIRAKFNGGKYSRKGLALEYKVSIPTIDYIVSNRGWVEDQVTES